MNKKDPFVAAENNSGSTVSSFLRSTKWERSSRSEGSKHGGSCWILLPRRQNMQSVQWKRSLLPAERWGAADHQAAILSASYTHSAFHLDPTSSIILSHIRFNEGV